MKHTEKELQALKEEVSQMWKLVLSQLEKAKQSFLNGDVEMAREIASREKRVDAFELKIDSDCENYIALYSPVAVDLRLVLSLIKISITLERIGDFAEAIARHIIENGEWRMENEDLTNNSQLSTLNSQLLEDLQMEKMFDILIGMLSDSFVALESENTKISGKILSKDDEIDSLYHSALDILTNYMEHNPAFIRDGLKNLLLIRKLERIGDHCSNIVEEIVFYVDAKVLKHNGRIESGKLRTENSKNNV
jgi:phosphate transport system protein